MGYDNLCEKGYADTVQDLINALQRVPPNSIVKLNIGGANTDVWRVYINNQGEVVIE